MGRWKKQSMAKKNYNLEQTAEQAAASQKNLDAAQANATRFAAKNAEAALAAGAFEGFEDKSLPPILKARGIPTGTVIMGEFDSFGKYEDDKIETALITVHQMDYNPDKKEFVRTGARLALPVSAVLARATGVNKLVEDKKPAEEITGAIEKAGYGKGTLIIMTYQGTGKERKGMNAPHLWDIKFRKPGAETSANKNRK
jgi:hypothetical protein